MKKRINLTIDDDLYADLGRLPRSVSVSEVTTFLLKCYMETIKRGREVNDEEFDRIIEGMGGEDFKARMRMSLGPAVEKLDWIGERVKAGLGLGGRQKEKKGK